MPQPSHHRLFQEKTLNQALKSFLLPADIADRHQTLLQWVQALESGTLNVVKETSLHGDFLRDVFQDVLGDRSVIGGAGQQALPTTLLIPQRSPQGKVGSAHHSIYLPTTNFEHSAIAER